MTRQYLLTKEGWLEVVDFRDAQNGDWIATVDTNRGDKVIVFCRGKDSYAYLNNRKDHPNYVFEEENLSSDEALNYEQVLGSFISFYESICGKL